jgi:hypothetical protein
VENLSKDKRLGQDTNPRHPDRRTNW